MQFDTLEFSDPRFERDHLRLMTIKSRHLGGRGDVTLFIPPNAPQDIPIVLLLHGVYASHWAWTHRLGAHLTALSMMEAGEIPPMMLVMPSDGLWGDGSAYIPHSQQNFEAWIMEDVLGGVKTFVTPASDVSPVFIAGLSMGGFGALRLGAKYPEHFRGISAHSSVTHLEQMALFFKHPTAQALIDQRDDSLASVLYWLRTHQDRLPPLRFDCGREDVLLEANRELHEQLVEIGIDHDYEEFAGGHSLDYWETHLRDTLRFFGLHLR